MNSDMIAIDLTTLATRENSPAYAWFVNREFELGVEEQKLEQLESFSDFAALPQVASFFARAQRDLRLSEQIEEVIDQVDNANPLLLRKLVPAPGSIESVRELSAIQRLIYVTRRPRLHEASTRVWLQQYNFPGAEVFFCLSDAEKWLHAMNGANESERIYLVDEQSAGISAYRQFGGRMPDAHKLQRRSCLIAFGRQQKASDLLPVHTVNEWEEVINLLATAAI